MLVFFFFFFFFVVVLTVMFYKTSEAGGTSNKINYRRSARPPLISINVYTKFYSCIKVYEHSCLKLCLNGLEVVFKQQNPFSSHDIHMLFEHGF